MTSSNKPRDAAKGTINVLVAVSPRLFAELIAERLTREGDITVAETCWDTAELTARQRDAQEDVVFLDPKLVTSSVVAFADGLPSGDERPHLVMLTSPSSEYYVPDAMNAGCTCFASTDLSSADLVQAVRDACAGQSHMDEHLLDRFSEQMVTAAASAAVVLTEREYDVLLLAAEGLSAPATADRLGLSVNTVRHHLQNVLTKLSVHSKLEAVSAAIRMGLLPPRT